MNTGPEEADAAWAALYASFSEEELVLSARSYDSLVPAAQQALRQEFSNRKLTH